MDRNAVKFQVFRKLQDMHVAEHLFHCKENRSSVALTVLLGSRPYVLEFRSGITEPEMREKLDALETKIAEYQYG